MTGTADTEAEEFRKIYNLDVVVIPTNLPMIRDDQADVIYKNEDAKYRAVVTLIEELHQKGQPTLVGTISIENSEKLSAYLQKKKIPHEVLNAKNHAREAQIVANAGAKGSVTIATNMAGRGTDIKLTSETAQLGGLCIIGTERHESRRIDNQLRGRSGRQGDAGRSKFFLSLEDNLMRIFGSQRISGIMHTLGMQEDEPIEHKMISKAIERAQKKVESHNFEIRKHLLDYDNVMNDQRTVIYALRRDILSDNDNIGLVNEMVEDVVTTLIENNKPPRKVPLDQWDWMAITKAFQHTFNNKLELSSSECYEKFDADVEKYLATTAKQLLTDKFARYEPTQVSNALREILLSILDHHWKEHLLSMDHLKEGINLRAYAQKDPLNEYKREAFELFTSTKTVIKQSIVNNIFYVQLYTQEEVEALKRKQQEMLNAQMEAHKRARAAEEGKSQTVKRSIQKVGRNDPCPCGSGKKFKQCHGV